MVLYKIRTIAKQVSGDPIEGLTIPKKISIFFENTSFTVEKSGTSIVFTSGANQTVSKEKLENYSYEDCISI